MRPRVLLPAALAALAACGNPAVDRRIDALGLEQAGVEKGEFHRPGQPCLLCHDVYGGATVFSVAGTIYGTPTNTTDKDPANDAAQPVNGVKVTLTDSFGKAFTATTNCIGNFSVTPDKYAPDFPLRAEIEYPVPAEAGATKRDVMATRISRDGSCAGCHVGDRNQKGPGRVYCSDAPPAPFPPPDKGCPGVP